MRNFMFTFVLLSVLVTTAHAKQFKVEDCDSSAMADINWAVDFIDKNIDEMLAQASFIPSKYGDAIKKKWPTSTLKCSTKKKCEADVGGYHRGGNKINLCWDSIRDSSTTRCDLVGIIMHEKAHAANVPIEKKHNDANEYAHVRTIDLVYRFDDVVEQVCLAPPATSATGSSIVESLGTSRLSLGEHCSSNTQCGSNNCGAGGVCVCDDNNDCGSDSRCKKRIGKNYCVPTGGDFGDYCEKNSDCSAGKCEKKSCVCEKDNDCTTLLGDTNFRCAKPGLGFGKNFCQGTSVANGGACQRDSDCASDKCKKDKCEAKK